MAILAFQKPDKVIMLESTDKFGKLESQLVIRYAESYCLHWKASRLPESKYMV